ncbi:MAG: Helix-turn-helix protein [Amycolatopsis sp.]|uniref:helix-turn-helix domain-containing protein n=1 Tax=Amycolatopsis sp. TaxID=37632 RepID=UPI0026228E4B|nr:helix-turn-helix transcriptional regulator [Amycolatopsis sp.]MCU1687818.1 Helix-turn-helix protein [Amycolatopsis sp.]
MATEPPGVHIAGGLLRQSRKLAGYSLVPFADLAGISFQYLSQIERGDRESVSPEVFARICDALGITDRRELLAKAAA